MTITTRPAKPAPSPFRAPLAAEQPIAVWDIPTVARGNEPGTPVRSIGVRNRTSERSTTGPMNGRDREFERGGVRQDLRAGVLLGAFAGCALLVGSSLGGIFTDHGDTPIPSDATREVVQAEIR